MTGMSRFLKSVRASSVEAVASEGRRCTNQYLLCFTLTVLTVLFAAVMLYENEVYGMTKQKHIVLLGASVGHDWKIEALPERLKQNREIRGYRFEFVGEYAFDKTVALNKILQRKQNKPDAIFIKECAAYFPGDLDKYQELMQGWINACRKAGVTPIPTTVVPIIKDESLTRKTKDFIKSMLGRSTSEDKLVQILKYNDWIRIYAASEKLVVLDLESQVRISAEDRSLKLDLHSGDGLHLNPKAYKILDAIVIPTLDRALR